MPNPRPPRRPSSPGLWVGLVVVALVLATTALGRPVRFPDAGAAGWLPADGTRQRFAAPAGTIATEWALDRATGLIGSGPTAFTAWLGLTDVDWQTAALARLSAVVTDASGQVAGRSDTLFSVATEGLRTEVEAATPGTARIFVPGRLDLPVGLFAGRTWDAQGVVIVPDGDATGQSAYRADYTTQAPTDPALAARGCVVIAMTLQVDGQADEQDSRTWCPGAGLLGYADAAGDWQPTDATTPAAAPADAGFDWSSADRIDVTSLAVNQTGPGVTYVSPVNAPGVQPDGTLVFTNSVVGDVIALDPASDPPPVAWHARPGGHNTAGATFGGITVAAGTARWLVAYDPSGQWLWQQRLTDLAVVAPARLDDLVVVATLDGAVTAYDLATGAQRWRRAVPAEVRVAPVVASGRVLVVDQSGQLTCLDAAGAEQWTADVGRVERFGVAGDEVILPASDGPHVQAVSLADGSRVWRVRETVTARDVIVLDTVVVLRDDDESVALDPATGARRWSRQGARTYAGAGGGDRVLLLAADRLLLLDGGGRQVREWPVAVGDVTNTTDYLVAAEGRVLVYGPAGIAVGVAG